MTMHCTNCGQPRAENATVCESCGERIRHFPAAPEVPNYLVQSILVTLCCCIPFGVVAIVYSSNVNGKLAAGDIAGAQEASKKAKMWAWIAFGAGVLLAVLYFLGGILGALGES